MTKPAPPKAGPKAGPNDAHILEIDAIDVAEWERDQHTPRAASDKLAALVRQTVSQPPIAEPPNRPAPTKQGRVPQAPGPAAPPSTAPSSAAPPSAAPPSTAPPSATLAPRGHRLPTTKPPVNDARPTAQAVVRRIAAQARGMAPLGPPPRPVPPPSVPPGPSPAPLADPATAPQQALPMGPLPLPPQTHLVSPQPMPAQVPLASPPPMPMQAPFASPPPMPPPLSVEAHNRLGTASDAMPSPPPSSRAASAPSLGHPVTPPILSWLASHRAVVLGGAAVAVLLLTVVAVTRGDAPRTQTMSAALPTAGSTDHPAPQPSRNTEAPAPNLPGAAAAVAPAPAEPTADPTDPSAEPETTAKSTDPRSAPASGGPRKTANIVSVSSTSHDVPVETDDDMPATARARAAYNAGNQALFEGNSDAAIRAYRQALSAAPTFPPGFRGLGLAYAQKGNNGLAIMSLRTYLNMAPRAKDAALIKQRIADLQASEP